MVCCGAAAAARAAVLAAGFACQKAQLCLVLVDVELEHSRRLLNCRLNFRLALSPERFFKAHLSTRRSISFVAAPIVSQTVKALSVSPTGPALVV